MKLIPPFLKRYHKTTSSLLYSYLISLPLLLMYQLLIMATQPDPSHMVRISVDVWVQSLFSKFGYNTLSITLLVAAVAGLVIFYIERKKSYRIRPAYFLAMLLEAVFYAIVLAMLISSTVSGLLQMQASDSVESISVLQRLALSLGAGLYEELFFRVILVSLFFFIFKGVFRKQWISYLAAAIVAAMIFSLAHYTGALGDAFTIRSFLFRFLFGMALNAVYVLRGFGMAAWTHAMYDIMVIAYL